MTRQELNIKIIEVHTELEFLEKGSPEYMLKDLEFDRLVLEKENPSSNDTVDQPPWDLVGYYSGLMTAGALLGATAVRRAEKREEEARNLAIELQRNNLNNKEKEA